MRSRTSARETLARHLSDHDGSTMMSGYASSGTAVQEACASSVEHDWRFAELVARSFLQPELALRYALEPRNVLAEFGIATDSSTAIPALAPDVAPTVTIVRLDQQAAPVCPAGSGWCYAPEPTPSVREDSARRTVRANIR
ncbi:hypothetical protein [Streptomyces sp. NPDC019890]|uniref:hypothetical protein n=1 Tax=Streptomyces sp. NPDC019890 TaxID=3365064 RepID=UPI0038515483